MSALTLHVCLFGGLADMPTSDICQLSKEAAPPTPNWNQVDVEIALANQSSIDIQLILPTRDKILRVVCGVGMVH